MPVGPTLEAYRMHDLICEIIDQAPAGSWLIDVGANTGRFTLRAARRGLRVLAFEPSWQHANLLRTEASQICGPQIVLLPIALGDRWGTADLAVTRDGNPGWNTIVPGFMSPEQTARIEQVPVGRLDDLALWLTGRPVCLVKIDVEGYELPVVAGAVQFLSACRAPVIMEVAPGAYPLLGYPISELTRLMTGCGYQPDRPPESLTVTSDLLWQKTLQPGTHGDARPGSEALP